jgi:hypothetical protein
MQTLLQGLLYSMVRVRSAAAMLLLSLSLTLIFAQKKPASQATTLAFTHATVIDATGAEAQRDMTVTIVGNRIAALGRTGQVKIPAGAQVIDATGKFLIPGLWDMHAHLRYDYPGAAKNDLLPYFFSLNLANGVTGLREMGGPGGFHMHWLIERREAVAKGTLLGPRLVVSGQALDGPIPVDGAKLPIRSAAEGREAVRQQKKSGVDFVKVYETLPRETYFAIADECKQQGLAFAGHVPKSVSAEEASNAGQRDIEHVGKVRDACYIYEEDAAKPDPDPDPRMTERLKGILRGIWSGQYNSDQLTSDLIAWLKTDVVKGSLRVAAAEQGELLSLELRRNESEGKSRIYLYKATHQKTTRYYKLLLTEEGKLNWLLDEPDIYNEQKAAALFATFKKNQTWYCPTLVALRAIAWRDDFASYNTDPRLKYAPPAVRELLNPKSDARFTVFTPAMWAKYKRDYEKDLDLVGRMRRAGVEILAGSDISADLLIPGFSLHDELVLLVKAGLTPMEALQAATRNPARYLGQLDSLGTVEVGKIADLVLLDANPLSDIRHTQKINAVVVNSRLLDRKALDELLAKAAAAGQSK